MANCIERDIFVLRDASCVAQPIEYVQGTNAVPILLHVRDYNIPAGSTARVYVEWPSTKGEYDTASIEGNDVNIDVKDTMFSETGKCFLQLCIVNGEDTLVTFSYPVVVKKNRVPGITKPSENQSDFLDEYLKEINDKIEVTTQQVIDTEQAKKNALTYSNNAEQSAQNAAKSEANALQYANDSQSSANAAKGSENNALTYKNEASTSAVSAEQSNQESKQSADKSAASAEQSAQSESNAFDYAESAKNDAAQINGRIDDAESAAQSAEQSAQNAAAQSLIADEKAAVAIQQAMMAESFTHGGTGLRENEAVDNAQYYLAQAKQISQSMNGLIPIGTIPFADLALETNQVNKYMFNISDDFVTDDTFKEGAGHSFPAGTNVFRTNDGYWDCLAGSFQTPNGDTKDNVTAFVQASTRANIQSGETHSVIFGKIAKFFADLKTVAFTGSYKDLSDKPSASDVGAVATGGNVAENTVAYTEASALTELSSGEKLGVAFGKLKLTVKNVISIIKLLGSTDISKIEDGTVTGILSALNTNLSKVSNVYLSDKGNSLDSNNKPIWTYRIYSDGMIEAWRYATISAKTNAKTNILSLPFVMTNTEYMAELTPIFNGHLVKSLWVGTLTGAEGRTNTTVQISMNSTDSESNVGVAVRIVGFK